MDFMELLLKRRSVRSYREEMIAAQDLKLILAAGLAAPSGRNRKPWELVAVQNPETLQQLSGCRVGAAQMLAKAGAAVLVFADPEKTDVWTEDCSIVMTNMHLMASALGLGSCWIQGRQRDAADGRTTNEYCRSLLNVPDGYVLEAILSVGVPSSLPEARQESDLDWTKVHMEAF